ncbi:MAG: hypothetical protein AMJ75_05505 [Phycisphaerae bacterium SM1_79]|nr:MAG: hypothetical protein AMJ75_05505 [Phycisphaerae bacterium SM1_79]
MGNEKESSHILANALFLKIFQCFRMSIQPSKLIIAFMAMAAICLAGWIMDFSNSVVAVKDRQGHIIETELKVYLVNPRHLEAYITRVGENADHTGVFSTLWRFGAEKFHGALDCLFRFDITGVVKNIAQFFQAIMWAVRYHWLYCMVFFVIILAAFSIAGGAICRIAALQFAQGEKPGLIEALRFSLSKFTSLFTAPLIPMVIIVVIGLLISLLGLVGNLRWAGELIMAIFMLLALIAGAFIAVLFIGTIAGFNLMFPAVAYDGSDCLDAISRSLSYVYAKPWRMGFYTVLAAVYGAVCYIFVRFFAFLMLWITYRSLQLGFLGGNTKLTTIWPPPAFMDLVDPPNFAAANWSVTVAAVIVYLLLLAVVVLIVSYIISFYFSANTIIYSLMRKKVDNTDLGDVYTISEEINIEPTMIESEQEKEEPEYEPEYEPESEPETESEPESEEDASPSKEQ